MKNGCIARVPRQRTGLYERVASRRTGRVSERQLTAEISILMRDRVPSRTIAYPLAASQLNQVFETAVPLDKLALFFLYDSSPQSLHYDPAKDSAERYPILALVRGIPELKEEVLAGDMRDDPEVRSILVFPVKARIKPRIADAVKEMAVRPMIRWMTAKVPATAVQRPLVLIYDEPSGRVSAKFAEEWDGREIDRRYY